MARAEQVWLVDGESVDQVTDVVRALQSFHALIERTNRCLGLGLGRHHERRSLTSDLRRSSGYVYRSEQVF